MTRPRHLPRDALGQTDGEPVCPPCGCLACYVYRTRRLFKCKACGNQFTVTSGTIFASRKLPVRDYLLAIAIFVNAAKGVGRPAARPRPRLSVQDRLRAGAQAARDDGGR